MQRAYLSYFTAVEWSCLHSTRDTRCIRIWARPCPSSLQKPHPLAAAVLCDEGDAAPGGLHGQIELITSLEEYGVPRLYETEVCVQKEFFEELAASLKLVTMCQKTELEIAITTTSPQLHKAWIYEFAYKVKHRLRD